MGTTGDDIDYSGAEFTARTGLIPRTVQTLFERVEETRLASGPGSSWECRLSFLELYNEEIIDLLSGSGLQITIREEREGRIVWAGVREVKVKTLAEVMSLLQQGSERRKTGETSMNASSSRSHAIFSLTLVQKKRAGTGTPASLSLTPSTDRPNTPTRALKRPSSTIGMSAMRAGAGTPTTTRTVPPSSFTGKSGISGIPHRTSIYGSPAPSPPANDDFIVVTSKFNMVDLAGSERLKRTAAQGERMKEGISINSGLLALGNVISTRESNLARNGGAVLMRVVADPIKARGHIPYRDSKLTRMLQDSIGGNALTTMIACVSPIEYNVTETLNTIKYASRARNIKNIAKINAVEAGWDDVEHLQATVLKLRKQLAALDGDGKEPTSGVVVRSEDGQRQTEKLILRLAELQKEHTEVSYQFWVISAAAAANGLLAVRQIPAKVQRQYAPHKRAPKFKARGCRCPRKVQRDG
jgi:kinesin family protein 4/21/27